MKFLNRAAHDMAYLLLGLPLGVAAFTWEVTGWATSLGTLIVWIGVPLALLTVAGSRGFAMLERKRAALLYGAPLPARYRRRDGKLTQKLRAVFADAQTWRDLGWNLIALPVTIVQFTFGFLALYGLAGVSLPIWYEYVKGDFTYVGFNVNSHDRMWLCVVIGAAMIVLAPLFMRGVAVATGAISRGLLAPNREEELEQRVERLTETRDTAVDTAATDLARIERDLHDGAQARLVSVALDIGIAEDKLARGDTEGAAEIMARAREGAKEANAELRSLARGIRPPLLADRGLEAAVRELAARSPIPTAVAIHLDGELETKVETCAYFVVAEALTNAAKHSGAARATVRITRVGDHLEVEVRDLGAGGADPGGDGLAGLRRRVEVLDGTLSVSSPAGEGTILRAELPCAS